jgi:hypothetical protein
MISTNLPQRTKLVAFPCLCCDRRLTEREQSCPDCETPSSLSQAVATRGEQNHFISVLGASNAGKTVYLGMLLDMLHKGPESFHGIPGSSHTVDLQQQVITALERRMFPEKTSAEADTWNWLHCEIARRSGNKIQHADLICPDFAGEAIAIEISQPGLYPSIREIVGKSSGVLILCDSTSARNRGAEEDLFAMKLATYISQLHQSTPGTRSRGSSDRLPAVGIIFTKSDDCPDADADPKKYASNNTPRLYDFCRRSFPELKFFAAAVAGNTAEVQGTHGSKTRIPLHLEPKGILEPVQWILQSKG